MKFIAFVLLVLVTGIHPAKAEDTLEKHYEKLLSEREAEIDRAYASRNLGLNFGLGGALLGFICVSFAYYYQYRKVQKINIRLEEANEEIRRTQEQLIKSEKLAAYGIMASRMAHEIQNPLNFVNNFSSLSEELLKEIKSATTDEERSHAIATLTDNLRKINHHGKRAGDIVRELENHSRSGTAQQFFES